MESVFHETQDGSLCAQHCLNSLLQGDYYSAVDLAQIAEQLDKQERLHMAAAGNTTDYQRFLAEESTNYDDSGFFSIQVLQKALEPWNLELIPYKSQNQIAEQARLNPTEQKAFIMNFKQHWYTIRKLGIYWFNLNSLLKKPQLISDTYLSILLAQLEADGYSIFVVGGELIRCQADTRLYETPLNVKQILSSYKQNTRSFDNDSDNEDEELKKALEMSLIENDKDLDANRLKKSSIDPLFHYDEELNRAIQMSLQSHSERASTSSNVNNQEDISKLSPNTLRKKRLEHFEQISKKNEKNEES